MIKLREKKNLGEFSLVSGILIDTEDERPAY